MGGATRREERVCEITEADRHIPITMISAHGFEGTNKYKLKEKQYVIMSSVPNRSLWLSVAFRIFVIDKFKQMGENYDINEIVEELNKSGLWRIDDVPDAKFKVYCPGTEVSNLSFTPFLTQQELEQTDTFLRGFADMKNYETFNPFRI